MKRFSKGLISIIVASVLMSIISLPDSVKSKLPNDPVSTWMKSQKVTLGLDLQGGTQLDYRLDLRNVNKRNNDDDDSNDLAIRDVIQGVLATIERRVNGLGVSEPQIYTSNVAGEDHIIVELAGIKDIEEAKRVVGKTIQLEFKEKKTELDTDERAEIDAEIDATLKKALLADADFVAIGENIKTSDEKIMFRAAKESFNSELSDSHKEILPTMEIGEVYKEAVNGGMEIVFNSANDYRQIETMILVQLIGKESKEKTESNEEEVQASHILIAYEGSERADESVVRTKDEALAEAEKVLGEAQASPDLFADLAKTYSDGPSSVDGGDLGFFGRDKMTKEFDEAAFSMEVGAISEVVETEFGYHIIKVTDKKEAKSETYQEDFYTYNEIAFDVTPDQWKPTGLDGSHFKFASVTYSNIGSPEVTIQFDNKGADLFAEITERLVNQQMAIFVGGELISAPNVNQKINGGNAVITGGFSLQEALDLAKDLNTGAIDAPIILSGQHTISATLGDNALRFSLFAGILGLIALVLFMIAYYRVLGVFAVIALVIYSVIIIFILKTTPIVMTLAGIAGIILSIGMAVDANILIFERTEEELAEGKNFLTATATGFERAWTSIRDSNISSLITCVILWSFGNSIIKGFALMLGLGILISMFTAINVTRALLNTLHGTKIAKSACLLGIKKVKSKKK